MQNKKTPQPKTKRSFISGLLGLDFFAWTRMLLKNSFKVETRRVPLAIVITFVSAVNTLTGWLETLILGYWVSRTEIKDQPIFIIGHWRSGTTLLHELLALDTRHTFPSTYDCFNPSHFLLTKWFLKPLLSLLIPAQRVQDNMASDLDRPQEDELALCLMGACSPYHIIAFPNHLQKYKNCYDLEEISPEGLKRWKGIFLRFLRRITFSSKKRIIIKSPTHTFRIKILLGMFPEARFVHIVRDPYRVFQSTMHMWRSVFLTFGLQTPDFEELQEYIFEIFLRMHEKLEETRGLVPPAQFHELRYEDLVDNPVNEMRSLYTKLALNDYDSSLLPALEDYLAKASLYKTNRYELAAEVQAEISRRWGKIIKKYGYPIADEL